MSSRRAVLLLLPLILAAEPPVPKPEMRPLPKDVKPFEYVAANVPFYPKSDRWGVTGENIKKMQKPLDAAESMKHITTPKEFDLRLFVDETKLGGGKPIAMNWDERGRLWLAVTVDYPNELQPDGKGRDKIVVLGGRTGRDGIHGATFSSGEMSSEIHAQASSAVQTGAPIAEKKVGPLELLGVGVSTITKHKQEPGPIK